MLINLKEYLSGFTISFNIIILTETWLTESDVVQIYIEYYSYFQLNRVCNLKKRGGGVGIVVHKCIKAIQVEHITHQIADEIDMLSIKIILPNINNIIICAVYHIP